MSEEEPNPHLNGKGIHHCSGVLGKKHMLISIAQIINSYSKAVIKEKPRRRGINAPLNCHPWLSQNTLRVYIYLKNCFITS